jgi:hypothetical protein
VAAPSGPNHDHARPARAAPFLIKEAKAMLRRMEAEILFHDPNDVDPGGAALVDHGFEVEVLVDRIDDYSPAVWINAKVASTLDGGSFFDFVQDIVTPFNGEVLEAGDCEPPALFA